MNILGISGLEQAMPFKHKHWPDLDPRDYRISQGHDAAAALVCSGKVVAAVAEERFNRKKQSAQFPAQAIAWCLEQAGLKLSDIDAIVHGFDYEPYGGIYSLDPVTKEFYDTVLSHEALSGLVERDLKDFPGDRVFHVAHHEAHAASAYYTSGWDDCLVVVIDAMGEAHGTSVFEGRGGELDRIAGFSAQDSIGIFYSLITLHLGFDFNSDEYKIMGLAPYGDPSRFRDFFAREVVLRDDGSIRIPLLRLNKTRDERENYLASRAYLNSNLIPARDPSVEITDDHRDIAAALQECLNKVLIHICGSFGRSTGLRKLAMAGGVALNCTANGHLLRSGIFDDIYAQPASGDDGTALGAALAFAAENDTVLNVKMPVPFLGPAHDDKEVQAALAAFASEIEVRKFDSMEETCAAAADLIADGRVLAWYRGQMEFGPRALGNRSILADPGHPEMRDRINAMVKKREAFRPFAPAVSLEEIDRWFDVPHGTQFALHDHDCRCARTMARRVAGDHARQRLGAGAKRVGAGQPGVPSSAPGSGKTERPPDGAEHQFQRQRPAHRQHTHGGDRDISWNGNRLPVPGKSSRHFRETSAEITAMMEGTNEPPLSSRPRPIQRGAAVKVKRRTNRAAKMADFFCGVPLIAVLGLLRRVLFGRRPMPEKIEKIALLQVVAIGDTILMSSVWRDLREAFPRAEITVYVGESNHEIAWRPFRRGECAAPAREKAVAKPAHLPAASGRCAARFWAVAALERHPRARHARAGGGSDTRPRASIATMPTTRALFTREKFTRWRITGRWPPGSTSPPRICRKFRRRRSGLSVAPRVSQGA